MNVGEKCPPPSEGLLTTIGWTVPRSIFGAAGAPGSGVVVSHDRGGDDRRVSSDDGAGSDREVSSGGGGVQDGDHVTHYALEGAIFVTGATVQWLRDGLGIIDEAAETGPLAESVEDTAGVMLVPAFTGLGSPWWDPHARGTIVGLTRGVTRAHLARAAVEAMAFQTRDVVDSMATASGRTVAELRVDGGAAVMPLLLRLQADQLGVPVTRPVSTETTALGAAYLAGLAEGVWSTVADVQAAWQVDVRVDPSDDRRSADALYAQWLRAVERSRSWA
jgi:glycerol kinase